MKTTSAGVYQSQNKQILKKKTNTQIILKSRFFGTNFFMNKYKTSFTPKICNNSLKIQEDNNSLKNNF